MKLSKLLILLKVLLLPTVALSQSKSLEVRPEGLGTTNSPEIKSTRPPMPTPTPLAGDNRQSLKGARASEPYKINQSPVKTTTSETDPPPSPPYELPPAPPVAPVQPPPPVPIPTISE